MQLAQNYAANVAASRKDLEQIEILLTSKSQELTVLKKRREQLVNVGSQTTNETISSIMAENNGIDMTLAKLVKELTDAKSRLEQLFRDSVNQVSTISGELIRAKQQLSMDDSLFEQADKQATQELGLLADAQSKFSQNQTAHLQIIQNLSLEKTGVVSTLTRLNLQIDKTQQERRQLGETAGALQSRYESGRAPYIKQISEAQSNLKTRNAQFEIWSVMKEMSIIDSSISETKNELDELIKQSASGKRNAKKLIDPKEQELNMLLGKQDLYHG